MACAASDSIVGMSMLRSSHTFLASAACSVTRCVSEPPSRRDQTCVTSCSAATMGRSFERSRSSSYRFQGPSSCSRSTRVEVPNARTRANGSNRLAAASVRAASVAAVSVSTSGVIAFGAYFAIINGIRPFAIVKRSDAQFPMTGIYWGLDRIESTGTPIPFYYEERRKVPDPQGIPPLLAKPESQTPVTPNIDQYIENWRSSQPNPPR